MSRTDLLYGLPLISSGPNVNRLDRQAAAKQRKLTPKELAKAYNNWIQIFRVSSSDLAFIEYLDKMLEAGITPFDVGCHIGDYQLARIGDEGPYTKSSCRFILRENNFIEQIENGKFGLNR